MDWERFKQLFPQLAKELDDGTSSSVSVDSVRTDEEIAEKKALFNSDEVNATFYSDYEPDVIDFIRRCRENKEALEIIDYLESRGEISSTYANRLKKQLEECGLRSFGSFKEHGYYERKR